MTTLLRPFLVSDWRALRLKALSGIMI